eukprot:m.642964 g.642964  ORF g.642964 m.642964 type:complete len:243 (+) comp58346_c0_seq39:4867-5595(+)
MAVWLRSLLGYNRALPPAASSVLTHWFGSSPPPSSSEDSARDWYFDECKAKSSIWYAGTAAIDEEIRTLFLKDLAEFDSDPNAKASWVEHENPRAGLAYIILLDQFTRNAYRELGKKFSLDHLAVKATLSLLKHSALDELRPIEAQFLLLPLEHSEDLKLHDIYTEQANRLLAQYKSHGEVADGAVRNFEAAIGYEKGHREVLEQFGRYPHRNDQLGRPSTAEEVEFLAKSTAGWMKSDKAK